MGGNHNGHHLQEDLHRLRGQDARGSYWKRVHRDWRFWVGVFLFTVAISVYVLSFDLSLVPWTQHKPHSDPLAR